MKHLAAYLLLGLGGNTSPSAKDITAVLESVGIEADNERLEKLLSELEGKDINEVRTIPLHYRKAQMGYGILTVLL
jgi:large subunit ribosomal protein LP2